MISKYPLFIFALILTSFVAIAPASAQNNHSAYVGDWAGNLDTDGQVLALVFHITENPNGLAAVMDVPAQDAFGIPATPTLADGGIRIDVTAAGIVFEGKFDGAGDITGTFKQRDRILPLILTPQTEAPQPVALNRPQTPQPPFDYVVEEVRFPGANADIVLAGTLTKPRGEGPFPAIVTITGSGPQDRDETIADHKLFFVIADRLTKAGFAVLRFDDRGVAGSTGDFASATSADFARDAASAVDFLAARADINLEKITLLGHSEGGLIAPLTASQHDGVSALLLLAPPVLPMAEIGRIQTRLQGASNGMSEDEIQEQLARVAQTTDVIQSTHTFEEAREKARQIISEMTLDEAAREERLQNVNRRISAWSHFALNHDPAIQLSQIDIPVLALFAEKDVSVSPTHNRDMFETIKAQSGADNWQSRTFPGLNHLFQTAGTGSQREYREIEETISPPVLDYIETWITSIQRAD